MNHIDLTGRLAHDPVPRLSDGGALICTFTLIVDRPLPASPASSAGRPSGQQADSIRCVAWGDDAATVGSLRAGDALAVEGRLEVAKVTRPDGRQPASATVACHHLEPLCPPSAASATAALPASPAGWQADIDAQADSVDNIIALTALPSCLSAGKAGLHHSGGNCEWR